MKKYYGSLDEKYVPENKTFLKMIKPFLSDKMIDSPKKKVR